MLCFRFQRLLVPPLPLALGEHRHSHRTKTSIPAIPRVLRVPQAESLGSWEHQGRSTPSPTVGYTVFSVRSGRLELPAFGGTPSPLCWSDESITDTTHSASASILQPLPTSRSHDLIEVIW